MVNWNLVKSVVMGLEKFRIGEIPDLNQILQAISKTYKKNA